MYDPVYRPPKDQQTKYDKNARNQQFGTIEQLNEMSRVSGISNLDWMSFAKSRNTAIPNVGKTQQPKAVPQVVEKRVVNSPPPNQSSKPIRLRNDITPPRVNPPAVTRSTSLQRLGRSTVGLDKSFNIQQRLTARISPPKQFPSHQRQTPPRQFPSDQSKSVLRQYPRLGQPQSTNQSDSALATFNRQPKKNYNEPPRYQTPLSEAPARTQPDTNYNKLVETVGNFGTVDYTMLKVGQTKPMTDWSVNSKRVYKGMGWKNTAGLIV